ncbi:hypothetical protein PG994_000150 [Apiospora phragmitis]|uniref:Uncharacterized protein n=1 Tax=Apiospora phragmitis TaxID=2905665 RepID=A0ABR1X5D0_9PEZI
MVTCRIPVIFYTGCGCTVLDESRDPKQHQWPGHTCTKACPPFDIDFRPGLCEGARSKILFNDDLGSDCPVAAAACPLNAEEGMPSGPNEQAPKKQALHQPGSLAV